MIETLHFAGRPVAVLPGDGPDLFFWLHGSIQSGRVGRRFSRNQFDRLTEVGVTVAYPEGIARHWNDGRVHLDEKTRAAGTDDVRYLQGLAKHLGARRVYAGGFSNGGQMVYRLLHDSPGFLSGALVVSATMPAAENFLCEPQGWIPTPMLLIHGTEDPIVPFAGGTPAVSRGRGRCLSFPDTAAYFEQLNGGLAETRAISVSHMGHVVPGPGCVSSEVLGPPSAAIDTAATVVEFFNLVGAGGQTR